MKQIRRGVFETNSSSVHSIAISKEKLDYSKLPKEVHFRKAQYGWEVNTVTDTASYLCTAATFDQMRRIVEILEKDGIECYVEKSHEYTWIDHGEDLGTFVEDLINDKDKLYRFLFGNSAIYTGNDNSCDEEDMCYCGNSDFEEYDDSTEEVIRIPNLNHDSEHYEYYVKGN